LSALQIKTAKVYEPLLHPSRYKGAHGGRGSGKSHFFGELAVEDALRAPGDFGEGLRMVCIREVQKDLTQSSKLLIEDKIRRLGLTEADGFRPWNDRIELPKDGVVIFKGMKDYSADSVKSLEGFHRAWMEEAQSISARSLSLLRPPSDRQAQRFGRAGTQPARAMRLTISFVVRRAPKGATVVQANWRDNPFWTAELEAERQIELERYPERYDHTYEGGYAAAFEGAYLRRAALRGQAQGQDRGCIC
jgi:phage terminase large subunit